MDRKKAHPDIELDRKKVHPDIELAGLTGSALLKKDSLTGKKMWVGWDEDGLNEVIFKEGEALVFPPNTLQVGTRVHLLPPEK